MSLLPFDVFSRSMFDPTDVMSPTWDVFDPFDVLDTTLASNLQWLNRPTMFEELTMPRVPRKFRVTVDCSGMRPESVKTKIENGKLVVTGKDETKGEHGDYSIREIHRTFAVPKNAETDKLVSFMTAMGTLIVEIPLKREAETTGLATLMGTDIAPRIVDLGGGKQAVSLRIGLTKEMDPSNIKVTCKDRDLIIRANDEKHKPDRHTQVHYYQRITLPENTDFNTMHCRMENNQLAIDADLNPHHKRVSRRIPIEHTGGMGQKSIGQSRS
jgi:HSP20 family molecular chaperone IbpA